MNIGEKMPAFSVVEVDGKQCNNYDYADKYALAIIFAGNECEYVKAYWHRIVKLKQRYEEDNLALLCVNSNDSSLPEETFEKMKSLAREVGIFPNYFHDETQQMARTFGAKCTPEVFLFNSKRELVYHGAIDDCWDNENNVTRVYLEDAIEYALDGIEVDFPEIPARGCNIKWKNEA
jgi:hypothetical protein